MNIYSQNGWLASANKDVIDVNNYDVPGANRHFSCASAVAPILVNFAADFHKQVEPIDTGTYDDWGYNFAVIPGSDKYANHSSGTAIDIDATLHPWHKKGTFNPIRLVKLQLLVKKYGIRWGGNYVNSTDEMHFEITETPEQVKARIAKMKLPMPKVSK